MLVLSRRKHQSVVIGDEVTLTVEEIRGSAGQRIFGASVRLGFQSPRYVSIYRSEWQAKRTGTANGGSSGTGNRDGKAKPAQPPRTGKVVKISDAQVRLRIQVPRRIPVRCNGTPTVGLDSEEALDGAANASTAVHHVTCHKQDRITICNNIAITALDFRCFVFSENP